MDTKKFIIESPVTINTKKYIRGGNNQERPSRWIPSSNTEEVKYTEHEIRKLMEGFKPVKDLLRMTKGTNVRYWVETDKNSNEYKFRKGGFVFHIDTKGRYIILRNFYNKTWSVNLNKNVQFFYKPQSEDKLNLKELPKINPLDIDKKQKKSIVPEITIKLKDLNDPPKSSKLPAIKKLQEYSNSYESDYSLPEEPQKPKKKEYIAVKKIK